MSCPARGLGRRRFFGALGIGLAATLAGCQVAPSSGETGQPSSGAAQTTDPLLPPKVAGVTNEARQGPGGARNIALTIDDGYCDECVAGYVKFAERSGIHLTFAPNGLYAHAWAPHANTLKPLIERGQVQIMNHTFNHPDLRRLSDKQIGGELDRNEDWVHKTFGVSTRPYYRPPFGFHDQRVARVAAAHGYEHPVLWNGSFSDSTAVTAKFLMEQAKRYLQPGAIMLGHANHPTVLSQFDKIEALIRERELTPVTVHEMLSAKRG